MKRYSQETDRFLKAWMQVRQIVQAANFNRFRRAGLSATQFMTLNVLSEEGSTLSELARKLNLSPASLKKTVDSLADRGLVFRSASGTDARKIQIVSTRKGQGLQNTASGEFQHFVSELFAAMSDVERQGLLAGLERFVELGSADSSARRPAAAKAQTADDAAPAKRKSRRFPPP